MKLALKLTLACTVQGFSVQPIAAAAPARFERDITADDDILKGIDDTKRYKQLVKMMKIHNSNFDDRKFWAYGCNCLMLNDRPLSDPGLGAPVDALDATCKHYKDCLQCVRDEHGDSCLPEMVKYTWKTVLNVPTCLNPTNSCDRALCECDKKFAKEHAEQKDIYDDKFHLFWSPGLEWDPIAKGSCPKVPRPDNNNGGKGGNSNHSQIKCCGGEGNPFVHYDARQRMCCDNGKTSDNAVGC